MDGKPSIQGQCRQAGALVCLAAARGDFHAAQAQAVAQIQAVSCQYPGA